jgi:nucleotide-binding universal stress UspA family protein
MKILLATDGSECSKTAVDAVAKRPWPAGSEVKIVSAIEIPYIPATESWTLPDNYYKELERGLEEQAELAVKDAVDRVRGGKTSSLEVSTKIGTGSPKDVIMDEAEKFDADLIVLGSHGYSGWERFMLGSVSQAVATHASCSVEIVRQKPAS